MWPRVIRRSGDFAAVLAGALLLASRAGFARQQTAPQRPAFKSATEAIWISATVVGPDGHLVTDLKKDDFEVRVDGEIRPITTFRSDRIPYALVSMFDLSGSMADNLTVMRRAMHEVVDRFEPGDRAAIGTFDSVPYLSTGFSGNSATLVRWVSSTIGGGAVLCSGDFLIDNPQIKLIDRLSAHGFSGIWDAAECGINAVASDGETPRRVVLLVTDGMDNVSTSTVEDNILRANQYGVMMYTILMKGNDPGGMNRGALVSLAEQTGGGFFLLSQGDDLAATFSRVSEELRHQYVFGVSPADGTVTKHKIEVTAAPKGSTTRAHRVFLTMNPLIARTTEPPVSSVAPSPPVPVPVPAPPPARAPIALPSIAVDVPSVDVTPALDRFEGGDWSAAHAHAMGPDEVRSLIKALRERAPGWVASAGANNERRRRLVVATFVLQILEAQRDPFLWLGGGAAIPTYQTPSGIYTKSHGYIAPLPAAELLAWAGDLLKAAPPLPAERYWHLGVIALLERGRAVDALNVEVDRARGRFPSEERWVLARAVSQEYATWPETRDAGQLAPPPNVTLPIEERYRDAMQKPSIRAEAHLRFGYFELRRGHVDAALTHFDAVGTPTDRTLLYWLRLFQGQAFERKGDLQSAIAAYRAAVAAAPSAQSASLALAGALAEAHRGQEAARLTARTLGSPEPPLDPWVLYTLPDIRFWDRVESNLRSAIRP